SRMLATCSRRLIGQRGPGDQPFRSMRHLHHVIAGIDAQAATDAFKLDAVADVDPGGTGGDAGAAVDAVPARIALLAPSAQPRLTAPALVADRQALLVQHRRLEARPRAHIGAHLL